MTRAIAMTCDLAHAAAWDAGNRLMRSKNLPRWDEECWNKSAETFHRLYAHEFLKSINQGKCPECET